VQVLSGAIDRLRFYIEAHIRKAIANPLATSGLLNAGVLTVDAD
jgi:hypothetical protein